MIKVVKYQKWDKSRITDYLVMSFPNHFSEIFDKVPSSFNSFKALFILFCNSTLSFLNTKYDTSSKYKRFKIETPGPNDFAMMKELLTRRLKMIDTDEEPDLIVIDGGKGQLGMACEVLDELNLAHIPIIGLAKEFEEIYIPNSKRPIIIPKNNKALHLLQQVRDESHRFAITYHRKLRSKRNVKSFLDDIYGIGPKRKKELINKFGTMKNIKEASIEELRKIVPEDIAIKIKES